MLLLHWEYDESKKRYIRKNTFGIEKAGVVGWPGLTNVVRATMFYTHWHYKLSNVGVFYAPSLATGLPNNTRFCSPETAMTAMDKMLIEEGYDLCSEERSKKLSVII